MKRRIRWDAGAGGRRARSWGTFGPAAAVLEGDGGRGAPQPEVIVGPSGTQSGT